jgi:hypothetical protein
MMNFIVMAGLTNLIVMAGLDPAIHVFLYGYGASKTWMPGTRPGMTNNDHEHHVVPP